jgi:hypothetical protein
MLYSAERLRLGIAAGGAALICLMTAIIPAEAHASGHRLVAELAEPAAKAKLVSSEVLWRCEGQTCSTSAELTTSPKRFCSRFVRDAGDVLAFRIGDRVLNDEEIAACNAAAD